MLIQQRAVQPLDDAVRLSTVKHLIPPAKRGGNQLTVEVPEVVNGIMYVLSTGCQWAGAGSA